MSLTSWRDRQIRAEQKRKALQMLALSGVVRPSDVDVRYPTPPIKIADTPTTPDAQSSVHEQKASSISESSSQSSIQGTNLFRWLRQGLSTSS